MAKLSCQSFFTAEHFPRCQFCDSGLDVIPWAWCVAVGWRHNEQSQLCRCTQISMAIPLFFSHPVLGESSNGQGRCESPQTLLGAQPHTGHTSPKREPVLIGTNRISCYVAGLEYSSSIPYFCPPHCWLLRDHKSQEEKNQHFPPTKPIQPPSLPLFHFPLHISKCPYKGTSFQTTLIIDSFHAEPRFFFHSWTPYGRKYVLTGPCFLSTQQVSDMDNLLPKHKEFYHSDNCLSGEDITSHCPIRRLLNARKCLLNKHLITLNKTVRELLQIYYPGKKSFSRHH